jgi:hypothetical protein
MNWTLKETLSKLAIETGGDWVALLPYAIFWVQNSHLLKFYTGLCPPLLSKPYWTKTPVWPQITWLA